MVSEFFKPLKEPAGKELIILLGVIMVINWIVREYAHNFLTIFLSIIISTVVGVVIYCIIKKQKNEKD